MKVYTKEFFIPIGEIKSRNIENIHRYYSSFLKEKISNQHRVIRFVVTKTDRKGLYVGFDLLASENKERVEFYLNDNDSVFDFRKRTFENNSKFNAVLLIPTGIGAEVGGHCGDGNAVARLVASSCDKLITHPNVVNASDINEMTENTLYVEGSLITRLLMGQIGLQTVRSNKILMLMDKHGEKVFNDEIINAVSSARITLGLDCDVCEMDNVIESISLYSKSGRAIGEVRSVERLFKIIEKFKSNYDAIGLSTFIRVPKTYHRKYYKDDNMVNPWGGIEAMLTHSIAEIYNMPCAHSPMMTSSEIMDIELGIVDPRKAPESSSITYLHCILKGLHKAPRITTPDKGITVEDISCVIIPDGCMSLSILACIEQHIPVIAVKENKNVMENNLKSFPFDKNKLFIVNNYWEAVGVMNALKMGISPEAARRPIRYTNHFKIKGV